jgi:type II secretory pathway component PulM
MSESPGKLKTWIQDQLASQVWYQQVRGKWEELPSDRRVLIQIGSVSLLLLIVVGLNYSALSDGNRKRAQIEETQALSQMIRETQEEIRVLKEQTPGFQSGAVEGQDAPISEYLLSVAGQNQIDPTLVTIGNEKVVGEKKASTASKAAESKDLVRETLVDFTIKKLSVRQLVKLSYSLQHGARAIKIRNLNVKNADDESAYLEVTWSLSFFAPKETS